MMTQGLVLLGESVACRKSTVSLRVCTKPLHFSPWDGSGSAPTLPAPIRVCMLKLTCDLLGIPFPDFSSGIIVVVANRMADAKFFAST